MSTVRMSDAVVNHIVNRSGHMIDAKLPLPDLRDDFALDVLNEYKKSERHQVAQRVLATVPEDYRDCYVQEVTVDRVCIDGAYYANLDNKNPERIWVPVGRGFGSIVHVSSSTDRLKELRSEAAELHRKQADVFTERQRKRKELSTLLRTYKTLNKFLKEHPSFREFVDHWRLSKVDEKYVAPAKKAPEAPSEESRKLLEELKVGIAVNTLSRKEAA